MNVSIMSECWYIPLNKWNYLADTVHICLFLGWGARESGGSAPLPPAPCRISALTILSIKQTLH